MRVRKTTQGLTVQATAGSNVVILGMDMAKEACDGLLGFAVHRTDPSESTAKWMEGLKAFEATDPGFAPGAKYPTNEHPSNLSGAGNRELYAAALTSAAGERRPASKPLFIACKSANKRGSPTSSSGSSLVEAHSDHPGLTKRTVTSSNS